MMTRSNLALLAGTAAILLGTGVIVLLNRALPETPEGREQVVLSRTFRGHSKAIENGTRLLQLLSADGGPDDLQAYVGRQVAFLGGGAPPGGTADLLIGDDVRLEVTIKPLQDVCPMAVMWEACVLGTVRRIVREKKVISIEAKPEDWVVVETW
jgi:hypothetical protein